jgi:hypothetical protein
MGILAVTGATLVGSGDATGQVVIRYHPLALDARVESWLQPRYEHAWFGAPDGAVDQDRTYLRRARIDIRGRVLGPRLTFRVQADVLRAGRLRDAYLDYTLNDALAVRVGQYSVPFGHRVSPRRDPFTERDVATSDFGSPTRDVGILVHGGALTGRIEYAAGVLQGRGADSATPGGGAMVTLRGAYALLGVVPADETDPMRTAAGNVVAGIGVQAATRNSLHDWSQGRSGAGLTRGDWGTVVFDVLVQRRGLAATAKHYLRTVVPADGAVATYRGSATSLAAAAAVFRAVEIVARGSWSAADGADPRTFRRDWSVGLNLYHRSHAMKSRFHYRRTDLGDSAAEEQFLVAELSMQF